MRIQMWDKQGNSELVGHKEVAQRLKEGWSYNKPSIQFTPKRRPRKVIVDEVVELKQPTKDLSGPEDLTTTIEEN
jgi:hypothetical protein